MAQASPYHLAVDDPLLNPVQRDIINTILQDCVDQLQILGGIMPNYDEKPSAVDAVRIIILACVLHGAQYKVLVNIIALDLRGAIQTIVGKINV